MITGAIFDYGGTLVSQRVPFELMLPKAIRATYRTFAREGLKSAFEEFAALDRSVFRKFTEAESMEAIDIPDVQVIRARLERLASQVSPR